MVREQLERRGIRDRDVLDAMGRLPRERFVAPELAARAYDDAALGIESGQTISQPYMVARMTEALDLPRVRAAHPEDELRVLDVGTGSGYQAAVLASLGVRVIGVERDTHLAETAERRLHDLGFGDVRVVVGDGSEGWPPGAPYAGVVVAAAAPAVPEPLLAQLLDGAAVVVPVGRRHYQELVVARRVGGRIDEHRLEPCVFVPLIGRFGFSS